MEENLIDARIGSSSLHQARVYNSGPGSLRVPEMMQVDGPGFSLCTAPLKLSGPGFRGV